MNNFNNNKKNIIIVAGGTGGHIYPAITLGKYLNHNLLNVIFITDQRGLNNLNLARLEPNVINVRGFAGKTFLQKIFSIILIIISLFRTLAFLKNKKADIVLGFGSYVQVPVVLAAKILKIKVILHEGNLILGNADKYFWKFARARATSFNIKNSSKNYKITGLPVRTEIQDLFERKYNFSQSNNKINILILGGSLGSLVLSKSLCNQICLLPLKIRQKLHITHQSIPDDIDYVNNNYLRNKISSDVKEYFSDIHYKLRNTTLVICRSGASTISENLVAGLPAIYIPLSKSIDNHQKHNAEMIEKHKAGWLIDEEHINGGKFLKLLTKLLSSKRLLEEISSNCKKIANPHASKNLYRLVLGVLSEEF